MKGKVGIYVDAVNVTMNGGFGLRYDVLRKFACRDGMTPSRMNVYLAFDERRAEEDPDYKNKTTRFSEVLRDFEYKVIKKPVQYYRDTETDEIITKSTVDMDMAVDMITQADDMDKLVLLTNNGSYVSVVDAVQRKGTRVELVGFDDMSWATALNPPLTAVRQPGFELGATAVELLLKRLSNPSRPISNTVLQPELIVRESCGGVVG